MRRSRTAFGAALLAALGGCASCDTVPRDALESCEASQVVPGSVATDILFVIDDSGSMDEEQVNVRNNLATFVQALRDSPIALDFQIGVTNTAVEDFNGGTSYVVGPNGPARAGGAIGFPAGRLVAVDSAGRYDYAAGNAKRILTGSSPTLVPDFEANVIVGTSGTGKEQPFRAARLALEAAAPGGANEGFVRPGSRVVVVFVSDEDDCSDVASAATSNVECHDAKATLDAVAGFGSFLRGRIAGEVHDVRVAAVVGLQTGAPWAPSCGDASNASCDPAGTSLSCTTAFDRADRYVALLDSMSSTTTVRASVCDASFAASLQAIADLAVPDSLPLDGAPSDWRMLAVSVTRSAGGTVPCEVALDGPSVPATADVLYTPPQSGRAPTLTFQGDCALGQGDRIGVSVVCAQ